jgi:hypothetical protein
MWYIWRGMLRHFLPFYPLAVEMLDLSSYDLVITSDSGPMKGVPTDPHSTHTCYCHSPMRYLWDGYSAYFRSMSPLAQQSSALPLTMCETGTILRRKEGIPLSQILTTWPGVFANIADAKAPSFVRRSVRHRVAVACPQVRYFCFSRSHAGVYKQRFVGTLSLLRAIQEAEDGNC